LRLGDIIAEVETDKATMEMEAFDEGTLAEVYVEEGQKVQVGQRLAILTGEGEEAPDRRTDPTKPAAEKKKRNQQPSRLHPKRRLWSKSLFVRLPK